MPTSIDEPVNFLVAVEASQWRAALWLYRWLSHSVFQTCSSKKQRVALLPSDFWRCRLLINDLSSGRAIIIACAFSLKLATFNITPFIFILLLSTFYLSLNILNFFTFCRHGGLICSPVFFWFCNFDLLRNFLLWLSQITPIVFLVLNNSCCFFIWHSLLLQIHVVPIILVLLSLICSVYVIKKIFKAVHCYELKYY